MLDRSRQFTDGENSPFCLLALQREDDYWSVSLSTVRAAK